jgi:hypothetical protein
MMAGSDSEIKINFLNYIFTTRLLAQFHYTFPGFSRSERRFRGQNEFLPTQARLARRVAADASIASEKRHKTATGIDRRPYGVRCQVASPARAWR